MIKIATIHTDFPTKYGIPRQAGLVDELEAVIEFEPAYRQPEAVRGLEEFSHIWLLWDFSLAHRDKWSATIKPPRLGGDVHMGVFATRSPHRPNPIGLSSVKLEKIVFDDTKGPLLYVKGADLMDNTPIYDIKPYLPYTDSHPDATSGFAGAFVDNKLPVVIEDELAEKVPGDKLEALIGVLSWDPRTPGHEDDEEYIHKMYFSGVDVHFRVIEKRLVVVDIITKK